MLDRRTGEWDLPLLDACGVDVEQMSEVRDPDQPFTDVDAAVRGIWPALAGATWFPVISDGFSSNFGAGAHDESAIAAAAATRVSAATTGAMLFRGAMEGVAISYARIADQLQSVAGQPQRILASGRVTQDLPAWLQILADVLEAPVIPVTIKRSTLRGHRPDCARRPRARRRARAFGYRGNPIASRRPGRRLPISQAGVPDPVRGSDCAVRSERRATVPGCGPCSCGVVAAGGNIWQASVTSADQASRSCSNRSKPTASGSVPWPPVWRWSPSGLAMVAFSPPSRAMINRFGSRLTLMAGPAIMAVGYVARGFYGDTVPAVIIGSTVVNLGSAVAHTAMPSLIMANVPITETASANGLDSLLRAVGARLPVNNGASHWHFPVWADTS